MENFQKPNQNVALAQASQNQPQKPAQLQEQKNAERKRKIGAGVKKTFAKNSNFREARKKREGCFRQNKKRARRNRRGKGQICRAFEKV